MKPLSACPRCGSRRSVRGDITGGGVETRFYPDNARFAALRLGVAFDSDARACAECGLLWTELYARDLNEYLGRLAAGDVKQWLEAKPDRPL